VLFVRRVPRGADGGIAVFVATSTRELCELRRLELERYDQLAELDFAVAGDPVDHPLFLVCTHGKHDRCCARLGRPVYEALREQVEEGWVWQSSHVGGDRFAGNVVALPDGVYYGRVDPAETWPVVEAALARRVHLPRYRGRSCYGFAAQAAELAVREATGELGVDGVLVRSVRTAEEGWTATVDAGETRYDVDVRLEEGEPTHLTCSTDRLRRPKRYVAGSPRARAA
jgi:Sucrase/ferredoxin-like